MTIEKQNIAIYKLLGYKPRKMWRYWTDKDKTRGSFHIFSKEDALKGIENEKASWGYSAYKNEYSFSEPEEYDDWYDLPSVDLNLMHEAEKLLNSFTIYSGRLEGIMQRNEQDWRLLFHATAAQRREALLKTLNLWEE